MDRATGSLVVALAQLEGTDGDLDANLSRAIDAVETAAAQGAALLLLPEVYLTGFPSGGEVQDKSIDPHSSPELRAFAGACAAYGIHAVVGFSERESTTGRVFNTAAWIDRTGHVGALYRKTHLFTEETRVFQPGVTLTRTIIDGVQVGILICYDIEFPETARLLALAGLDLLVVISANMPPFGPYHRTYIRARALENHCYVAYCNRLGPGHRYTYVGGSAVVDPVGKVVTDAADREGVVLSVLDFALLEEARREFDYLVERRLGLGVDNYVSSEVAGQPAKRQETEPGWPTPTIPDTSLLALRGGRKPLRKAQLGVYAGPGVWHEGRHALSNFLDERGLTWENLYPTHINSGVFRDRVDAVWIPGGYAGDYNRDLNEDGQGFLRDFVMEGGGFLATCAGSYFASSYSLWEGEYHSQPLRFYNGTARGAVKAIAPWRSWHLTGLALEPEHVINGGLDAGFSALYYGGPEFISDAAASRGVEDTDSASSESNLTVLGRFAETGGAALVGGVVGRGRVVLMSLHLEIGYDPLSGRWDCDGGHGANWQWLGRATNWVLDLA